ncbi:MAG: carboxymuconolactone decarboxylase family protein [Bacteroidetes bacterium]|nr:MAG: carboxymuconolactone decarboxylase family protein [Bacteroidota bacterium]
MKFTIPTKETAPAGSKAIFENLEKQIGFLPNLFAYIGHSPNALQSSLAYQQGNAKGAFNIKQREVVNLAVSQVNNCQYCLSAHTVLGKMNGFSEEEILQLRAGTHPDEKLNTIALLSAEIQRTHGHPEQTLLDKFFALGYNEAALVDLVALVADKVFANYINNIVQTPIDFPAVPELTPAQQAV